MANINVSTFVFLIFTETKKHLGPLTNVLCHTEKFYYEEAFINVYMGIPGVKWLRICLPMQGMRA